MHLHNVEFAGAIGQIGQKPPPSVEGLRQVAFAGRSNVGKSSLINRVVGRTRTAIARVSQQPGKTQEINFYRVKTDRGEFCLVDLPGYGYAKAPEELRRKWRPLISSFLKGSADLSGVVQLIDVRHGPSKDDLTAVEFLAELQLPVLFVLTKVDKLKSRDRERRIQETVRSLEIQPDQAIPFSALSGEGAEVLLETLGALVFGAEGEAGAEG